MGVLALSATLAKYFKTGVFDGGDRRGSAIASAITSVVRSAAAHPSSTLTRAQPALEQGHRHKAQAQEQRATGFIWHGRAIGHANGK